ncbi:hypothetical protein [Rahnella bonaserana]
MDTKAAFEKWWMEPKQDEIRLSIHKSLGYRVWQASRAAIEINLPPEHYRVTDKAFYSKEVIEAITSHGIRIKGKTE